MAAGYGNGTVQDDPGAGFGLFGMYRLSKRDSIGIAVLIAHLESEPASVGTYAVGIHLGHTVYCQAFGGMVVGPREIQNPYGGPLYTEESSLGVGAAVGLHIEFVRFFGLNTEVFLAKGFENDGAVGGVLIGPTFQLYMKQPSPR